MTHQLREWINLIQEGRHNGVPLLYHSTHGDAAIGILDQGVVNPVTKMMVRGKLRQGISLTRSVAFASVYEAVVFGFDAIRIRDIFRGRLFPHADTLIGDNENYHADYRREAEEFLAAPLPLHGFLVALWLAPAGASEATPAVIARIKAHPLYAGTLDAATLWKPGEKNYSSVAWEDEEAD